MAPTSALFHDYSLYGWRLRSERSLQFLHPADGDSAALADVEVRFAPVPLPEGLSLLAQPFIHVQPDGRILVLSPDGVRIAAENGRRLIVDITADVSEAELHSLLCGPATAALCHQRRQPPLHAAALAIGGVGVAVAGDSGAGKSTTARALMERGARLLTDDQAVIDPATGLVYPGYPSMKLWSTSAEVFGERTDPALRVRRGITKFHVLTHHVFQRDPVPLGAVVVLRPDAERTEPALERQRQTEAAALLHRFLLRGELAMPGSERIAFGWATKLAVRVPVWVLCRPHDLGRLDLLCDMVEVALHGERAPKTVY